MGCDIHLALEQLNTIEDVTAWRNVDLYEYDYYEKKFDVVSQYNGRDYDLFAALADVRNYGHVKPLDQPRGLPADVHELSKQMSDRYGEDGHSHSWCTLQELYDYRAKHGKTTQSGLVSKEDAAVIDAGGHPQMWCQGSSDKTMVRRTWTVDESPVDDLIKSIEPRCKRICYTWDEDPLPKTQAEKIRLVFFFDN